MSYESNLSNIIIRLKEAKNNQPTLTLQKISDQTGVSLTTVARIFAPDSENHYFKYESIQPIAAMLLGLNDLDMGNEEEKALKAILISSIFIFPCAVCKVFFMHNVWIFCKTKKAEHPHSRHPTFKGSSDL